MMPENPPEFEDGEKGTVKIECRHCGKVFQVYPCRKNTAKFCSRSCKGKAQGRPNLRPFEKGNIPWNKGVKEYPYGGRPPSEPIGLSKEGRKILWGCVLGDGSLSARTRFPNSNPRFEYGCTEKEMINHLMENLPEEFFPERCLRVRKKSGRKPIFLLHSRHLPDLEEFEKAYNGHGKTIPDIEFCPTILLYWYLGDGFADKYKIGFASTFAEADYGKVIEYLSNKGIQSSWTPKREYEGKKDTCRFTKRKYYEISKSYWRKSGKMLQREVGIWRMNLISNTKIMLRCGVNSIRTPRQ